MHDKITHPKYNLRAMAAFLKGQLTFMRMSWGGFSQGEILCAERNFSLFLSFHAELIWAELIWAKQRKIPPSRRQPLSPGKTSHFSCTERFSRCTHQSVSYWHDERFWRLGFFFRGCQHSKMWLSDLNGPWCPFQGERSCRIIMESDDEDYLCEYILQYIHIQ